MMPWIAFARDFGSGCRMIHARAAAEPLLELLGVLAEVMEEPGGPTEVGEPYPFEEAGGAVSVCRRWSSSRCHEDGFSEGALCAK